MLLWEAELRIAMNFRKGSIYYGKGYGKGFAESGGSH